MKKAFRSILALAICVAMICSTGLIGVISVSAAVGSLLNTALVVGAFVLCVPAIDFGGITMIAYVPTMLVSGAIELACMAALVPPVVLTLERTVLKTSRLKKSTAEKRDAHSAAHSE